MSRQAAEPEKPAIGTPEPNDVPALAAMIASAFHYLPASGYLIRDPAQRKRVFPETFRFVVEDALSRGAVYATEGCDAAALWTPIPAAGLPVPELDPRIARIGTNIAWRYLKFAEVLHERHPVGVAHDHLLVMAVRREMQHRGLGSMLLRRHHAYLDGQQRPAYLEAKSMSARALFRTHGYDEHGEPITLPDGSRVYPMMREPQGP